MSSSRDDTIDRLDSTVIGPSLGSQSQAKAKARHASGSALITFSDDDVKKLQKKREKEGLCVLCGDIKTHKKVMIRMVPETVHGSVYRGICLRCNPSPNLEGCRLSYGNLQFGWERTIRATDFKFRWERPVPSINCFNTAYVRKLDFFEADGDGLRAGRVSLVAAEDSVVESLVECADGRTIVSFSDIEKAQKMNLESKKKWFYDACARLCSENEDQVLINVRQNHILEDSIEEVLSFSQADLRKTWIFGRDNKLGEMSKATWYASVIEQICCPDAGFWQKCAMDETRVEINFHSDMVCSDYVRYFRFLGRILGKALIDGQLVRCRLAKHLYMLILGWPIMLDDLKEVNVRYHSYLKSLIRMHLVPQHHSHFEQESSLMARGSRAGVMSLGLHFSVSEADISGVRTRVPIVPNGCDVVVDRDNLPEYVDSCLKYRVFGRYHAQLNALLLGFFEVVHEPLLTVFDYQELEALLCGSFTGGKTEEGKVDDRRVSTTSEGSSRKTKNVRTDAPVKLATQRTYSTSSSWTAVQLPEALLIEDDLYDAVAEPVEKANIGRILNADEINYRLRKGRCTSCGIQTHKKAGMFKKSFRSLSNDNVLSGRCLICNPINAAICKNSERPSTSDVPNSPLSATEKTSISDFPHPPPSAPWLESCLTPVEAEGKHPQEDIQSERVSTAQSQDEVDQWLLTHLPSLQKQDVEKYHECLVKDGFDSTTMMEQLEEADLAFMKKAHRRALMKRL